MKTIEVCFTPDLYDFRHTEGQHVTIVIDVLRATTAICAALHSGVKGIIPVADIQDLKKLKENGYIIASEREGIKVDFADFGNSPFTFLQNDLKGKVIAYSTTNGTVAIEKIAEHDAPIYIGAYTNISILCDTIINLNKSVVIVCSGWKGKFSLEDAVIAGAYCERLIESKKFSKICDSSSASIDLWNIAKHNLLEYIDKCIHRQRLQRLGLDDVLEFCFTADQSPVVPIFFDGMIQLK